MMLKGASDAVIKLKMRAIHKAYHSETRGAGHQADQVALKALQEEVQKEMWESEKQKSEQQLQAIKDHINKLMEMIKEMMKIQTETFNQSQKILNN